MVSDPSESYYLPTLSCSRSHLLSVVYISLLEWLQEAKSCLYLALVVVVLGRHVWLMLCLVVVVAVLRKILTVVLL